MHDNSTRGLNSPATTADESTNNCPNCGAPIDAIATTGPGAHVIEPCGCTVGGITTRDLAEERVATDGGSHASRINAQLDEADKDEIPDELAARIEKRREDEEAVSERRPVSCPECEDGTLQVSDAVYADCDNCDAAVLRTGVGI